MNASPLADTTCATSATRVPEGPVPVGGPEASMPGRSLTRLPAEVAESSSGLATHPWRWLDRRQPAAWAWLMPAACMLAAAVAVAVDAAAARVSAESGPAESLRKLANAAEPFGNGLGVVLVLLTIFALDPARRRALPRVATLAWGAGLLANLVKLSIARARPLHWLSLGRDGILTSFGGLLPLGQNPSFEQSFPSAHTATAVGLALALAWLYPRGRVWFLGLATLVGAQRVLTDYHFPSDVLAGAALGVLTALVCFRLPWPAEMFEALERGPARKGAESPPKPAAAPHWPARAPRQGSPTPRD